MHKTERMGGEPEPVGLGLVAGGGLDRHALGLQLLDQRLVGH